MERIAKLAEMIREEIKDAKKYAKCAIKAKDTNASEARVFGDIANQELGHADKLHSMVVETINETKQVNKDIPDGMEHLWSFEHARIIDETAEARGLLMMLKD